MGSLRVLRVLDRLIGERGTPQRIRRDNGPELPATTNIRSVLAKRRTCASPPSATLPKSYADLRRFYGLQT